MGPDPPPPEKWDLEDGNVSGNLAKLHVLLKQHRHFAMVLLEYGDSSYRDQIIQQIDQMGYVGKRLTVDPAWPNARSLIRELEKEPEVGLVHVLGMAEWFRADWQDGWEKGRKYKLNSLNLVRNGLAQAAQFPLFIWLEPDDCLALIHYAPDFWEWRKILLSFLRKPVEAEALPLLEQQIISPFVSSVDQATRQARIQEITNYLDNHPEITLATTMLRRERFILYSTIGEWDTALAEGPIVDRQYEALGDVRRAAEIRLELARLLFQRGEEEEVLRILREDVVPIFERLGDIRFRAIAMGQIANILRGQGQLDEALRVHFEEELPVYEQLGDVRSSATTMSQIAAILQRQGQLDEALHILQEVIRISEQLIDIRSSAIIKNQIADIRQQQGKLDEAIRVMREEVIPVYEQLGDVRELAIGLLNLGFLLSQSRQPQEARQLLERALELAKPLGIPEVTFIEKELAKLERN